MRFRTLLCALLLAANPLQAQSAADLKNIAEKVTADVATARDVHEGKRGRPVFILEEHHNSRKLQIESAICLVRLHDHAQMRDIALEGYLLEGKPITTTWYAEAAERDFGARVRVAVQLLKEGEISCAEFAVLIYDDCKLYPIDKQAEYTAPPDSKAQNAPKMYLVRLGERNLDETDSRSQEVLRELKVVIDAFKEAEKGSDKAHTEKKRAEVFAKLNEYYDYVMSKDPWAWKTMQAIREDTNWMLSERIKLYREIERRALRLKAPLRDEDKEAMRALFAWFESRDRASTTMAVETGRVSDLERPGPVAMILGAAHTKDVVGVFDKQGRPVVTITPNARSKTVIDITMSMYARKGEHLSIYSDGLVKTLIEEFGTGEMKPRPVLMEPWFQAKAELYLLVDRVTHAMFEPPGPPDGGGGPPFGLNNQDFSGRRVSIDVSRIQIVPYSSRDGDRIYRITEAMLQQLRDAGLTEEDVGALGRLKEKEYVGEETFLAAVEGVIGEKRTTEHKQVMLDAAEQRAILFPVVLNHRSQSKRKEIWAKASLNREAVSAEERAAVEAMLMEALADVAEEGLRNVTKVEDEGGRVQLSIDTIAAFDTNAEGAVDISLGI